MSDINIIEWLLSHTAISITIEFFKKYSKQIFFVVLAILIIFLVINEQKKTSEVVLLRIDELSRGIASKDSLINEQLKIIHEIDAKKGDLENENLSYKEKNRILDSLNNVKDNRILFLQKEIANKDAEIASQHLVIQGLIADGKEKDEKISEYKRKYEIAESRVDSLEREVEKLRGKPSEVDFKVISVIGINTYGEENLQLTQRTRPKTDRASRVELIELILMANKEIPPNSAKLVTVSLKRERDGSVNTLTESKVIVNMKGGNITISVNVEGIELSRGKYEINASVLINGETKSLGKWQKEFR